MDHSARRALHRPAGGGGRAAGAPDDRPGRGRPLPGRQGADRYGGQRSAGRSADPAGLRAHRGPAGPAGGGRHRVRPGSALRRGRGPDLADDRGRLAGAVRPGGRGAARRARPVAAGAGPPVPVRPLGRAAGPPASGPGAAAGPAGLAGRRGGRAAGPAARRRARRLRRRDRPAGPAAGRLGHPRPGCAGADGRVRAAHLARRWPVERPVRAPGGRCRPRLAR
jgi:hypothetical protein